MKLVPHFKISSSIISKKEKKRFRYWYFSVFLIKDRFVMDCNSVSYMEVIICRNEESIT